MVHDQLELGCLGTTKHRSKGANVNKRIIVSSWLSVVAYPTGILLLVPFRRVFNDNTTCCKTRRGRTTSGHRRGQAPRRWHCRVWVIRVDWASDESPLVSRFQTWMCRLCCKSRQAGSVK